MAEPEADVLLARLAAGTLSNPERDRLAAALRLDPRLRQRVRTAQVSEVRLYRAVRQLPRPSLRHLPRPPSRPWWPWLALAGTAAAILMASLSLNAGLPTAGQTDAPTGETEPPATPPVVVATTGPFTLHDQTGTMQMAGQGRIELEAGSSGTMTSVAGTSPVVTLASGGARLHHEGTHDACEIQAGKATITAQGDVAVRYLQVPEGVDPAIEVRVGVGHARLEFAGVQHELGRGENRVIAPGGLIRAVIQADPAHRQLLVQASGGKDRVRWRFDADRIPAITCHHRSLVVNELQPGWQVHVRMDPLTHEVRGIEVPDQTVSGVLSAWDAHSRMLTVIPDHHGQALSLPVAATVAVAAELLGKRIRLSYDPVTRTIHRLGLNEPEAHPR